MKTTGMLAESAEWADIVGLYDRFREPVRVFDVFNRERFTLEVPELIQFLPHSRDYILSVPHAGLFVPTRFADRFDLSERCIVEIDLFADVIYEALDGMQVTSWLAPFFVDMNRERSRSDERRDAPHHLQNPAHTYYTVDDDRLLSEPYSAEEEEEVLRYYDLYHAMLRGLIRRMKRERGYALMIDGHSMTSVGLGRVHDKGRPRANFVVGTLGGTSAHPEIIEAFVGALREQVERHELDLTVAQDEPYAGGFITRKHCDPDEDVHVIQIEVTMDTYMYEAVDSDVARRYALKQPRVKVVRDMIRHAIRRADAAAKRIYR